MVAGARLLESSPTPPMLDTGYSSDKSEKETNREKKRCLEKL